jgi:hypothetical protein
MPSDTNSTPSDDNASADLSPWPSAPNGDGSEDDHWDTDSVEAFGTALFERMEAVTTQEGADALVAEANEATNIPTEQVWLMISYIVAFGFGDTNGHVVL